MKIPTYIVDAFTDEAFKGNPAGVCLLQQDLGKDLMLSIAKELGYSETAFVRPIRDVDHYSIRYFSPKMEIPLCGHATMASSKVLFNRDTDRVKIHFKNIQELDLIISKIGDEIRMEFPVYQSSHCDIPAALLKALGINEVINAEYNAETNIILIEIESSVVLEELQPDFEALQRSHASINGVLITAESKRTGFDFESRYFWPWSGTNEDPVTGGTHTFLTPYWSSRLNKLKMKSFQCSARTGFMEVELISDDRLTITSQARVIMEGLLQL